MSKKPQIAVAPERPRCTVTPAEVARGARARQPTKNFSGLFRGKSPSLKNERMVHWESLLERDAILLFEFSPGITGFREQPPSFWYFHSGRMRRYTADFEVTFRGGCTKLIEVKPWEKLQNPEEQKRLEIIRLQLLSQGAQLLILDDRQIRRKPLSENLKQLNSNRTPRLSSEEAQAYLRCLSQIEDLTFGNAKKLLGERAIWQLLDLGEIELDLLQVISEDTPISTKNEELPNATIYF
ncbi:TnsA endonuclease N-terminal domain-containing protein [Herbaspirillum sp. VT-16-41]|uniref:TnsA endonuclease N-terminal domain-containing protein n=1 Tax=Herbaspirillum sp. VT-16-41 TaxID=1953765 RepID=UPI0009821AB7|nr:TnsA endonuclease N-terminal domain-containing protein [Herbaspirillum sp. VT-16-41]